MICKTFLLSFNSILPALTIQNDAKWLEDVLMIKICINLFKAIILNLQFNYYILLVICNFSSMPSCNFWYCFSIFFNLSYSWTEIKMCCKLAELLDIFLGTAPFFSLKAFRSILKISRSNMVVFIKNIFFCITKTKHSSCSCCACQSIMRMSEVSHDLSFSILCK